ncbi:MAG TPA: anthrone oxygenase family protein [Chthoniobacter sp.]|nr:anthrone oxygenase family protein [Chthoniobacter sp.]
MKLFFGLTFATALATGLMAGVFFAFSSFVMKALGRLPAAEGISAMQSINMLAERSIFLVAFLGTAVACLALAVASFWRLSSHSGWLMVAGAAIYLLGCVAVTMICNVPMNNSLATMPAADPATTTYWTTTYLPQWTFWNHVRTVACLLSSGLLTWALRCP